MVVLGKAVRLIPDIHQELESFIAFCHGYRRVLSVAEERFLLFGQAEKCHGVCAHCLQSLGGGS